MPIVKALTSEGAGQLAIEKGKSNVAGSTKQIRDGPYDGDGALIEWPQLVGARV
jgi:hypothetical protein